MTTIRADLGWGSLTVTQDNAPLQRLQAAIDTSRARASDVSPAWRAFRKDFWENERLIFSAQGIPSWPSLSPAYARRKAAIAPGKTILRRTDRLYSSLTDETADSVYAVEPRTLQMGTVVPYSRYHQQGTERVPQRAHVYLLPEYWQRLNAEVFLYIADPFNELGNG